MFIGLPTSSISWFSLCKFRNQYQSSGWRGREKRRRKWSRLPNK